MTVSGRAKLAGIVGWPVAHSLSPRLHGYWLAECGIDGAYVPLAVRRDSLSEALNGLRAAGFGGVNLTIPHKEAGLALAHRADSAAAASGAANLLVFESDGTISARNTDAEGLAQSLRAAGVSVAGATAVLLGAGGAARGALLALDGLGVGAIYILNRNAARARALTADMTGRLRANVAVREWADWPVAAAGAKLIVNATSAGMAGHAALDLALDGVETGAVVCDIVYNPLETDLLRRAKARGLRTVDGLGMLMHQAAPSFEAFFGVRPSVTPALRALLEEALRGR